MDSTLNALEGLRHMSDVELSRRSGVSRSTLHRIENGATSPTLRTLRELAIAAGVDIDVTVKPLSDRHAARAARRLLEPAFAEFPLDAEDREWMDRLQRVAGEDPLGILSFAGYASSLLHDPETIAVSEYFLPLRLASAGDATGGSWALSGQAGMAALTDELENGVEGPTVLYVAEPRHAWRLLESPATTAAPATARLLVAPIRKEHGVDMWEVGPLHFVAPIQILLDAIGVSEPLGEAAIRIAREW